MASQLTTWVLALVLGSLLARRLGPDGSGVVRLATSLWGIVLVLSTFGAGTLITVETARCGGRTPVLSRALGLQLIVCAVGYVGMFGFVVLAGYPAETTLVVAVYGLSMVPQLVTVDARAAFFGMEQMSRPALADVTGRVLLTVTTVVVLFLNMGVVAVTIVGVANGFFAAGLIVVLLRRSTKFRLRPEFTGLVAIGRAAAPFLLLEATLIIYQQVDTVVMSFLEPATELGWDAAATVLFGTLLFIPTVLLTSLFPAIARLSQADPAAFLLLIRRALRFLVLVGVPIGLGTVALARPVCVLLYGSEFASSGPVLAVYGILIVLMFPIIVLAQHAIVTGQQRTWALFVLVGIVLTIPLDIILVPWCERVFGNGAIGGALSFLVTEALSLVFVLRITARGNVDRTVVRRTVSCIAVGAVMLAVVWPLRERFILMPVVVGAAVYVIGILLLRALDDEEKDMISKLVRRGSRRGGSCLPLESS